MRKELLYLIILFLINFSLFVAMNYSVQEAKFAYEYGNIATAVVEGRGYSDPFGGDSGPTSWMPPFYVFILVLLFKVGGVKTLAAMWMHFILQSIAYSYVAVLLMRLLNGLNFGRFRLLVVPLLFGLMLFNRKIYFIDLHDVWLVMLLSVLMIYLFTRFVSATSTKIMLPLMALALILPLTSPGLALAFLTISAALFLFRASQFMDVNTAEKVIPLSVLSKRRVLTAAVMVLFISMGVWTVRNYLTLGKMIPIKSNLWYDFYQADQLDDDGVVSDVTFMLHHPVQNPEIKRQYIKQGEIMFVEGYEHYAKIGLEKDRKNYFGRVFSRFSNAFLYTRNSSDLINCDLSGVSTDSQTKLEEYYLIKDGFWLVSDLQEDEFIKRLETLSLIDQKSVLESWQSANQTSAAYQSSPMVKLRGFLLSLIPFLAMIAGVFIKNVRRSPVFVFAVVVYLIHLSPYVAVSHYMRYQFPLLGMQVLLLLLPLTLLIGKRDLS